MPLDVDVDVGNSQQALRPLALHTVHALLPVALVSMGVAQVVGRFPLRRTAKLSAVSLQGQPRVQLMLPAATELAAKARSRMDVGASVLCQTESCSP